MKHTISGRGFKIMGTIKVPEGVKVEIYESSHAMQPMIWLSIERGAQQLSAHMPLDDAAKLRDQLTWLIENHYQVSRQDKETDA